MYSSNTEAIAIISIADCILNYTNYTPISFVASLDSNSMVKVSYHLDSAKLNFEHLG